MQIHDQVVFLLENINYEKIVANSTFTTILTSLPNNVLALKNPLTLDRIFVFFFSQTFQTNCVTFSGCLPGFHFVTGRSCVSCPSDTYQDEHGQKYCKTCPVNTGTFGKTRMTNQANCTGMAATKLR